MQLIGEVSYAFDSRMISSDFLLSQIESWNAARLTAALAAPGPSPGPSSSSTPFPSPTPSGSSESSSEEIDELEDGSAGQGGGVSDTGDAGQDGGVPDTVDFTGGVPLNMLIAGGGAERYRAMSLLLQELRQPESWNEITSRLQTLGRIREPSVGTPSPISAFPADGNSLGLFTPERAPSEDEDTRSPSARAAVTLGKDDFIDPSYELQYGMDDMMLDDPHQDVLEVASDMPKGGEDSDDVPLMHRLLKRKSDNAEVSGGSPSKKARLPLAEDVPEHYQEEQAELVGRSVEGPYRWLMHAKLQLGSSRQDMHRVGPSHLDTNPDVDLGGSLVRL